MACTARVALHAACVAAALAVGACSSGSSFTTGTLLGGGKPSEPPAPKPETPTDRAIHAGMTSARAQRCGYVFDPASVRQGYLAFESGQGLAADVLAKAEKTYDHTHATISKTVGANEDYCTDGQTSIIKRDLNELLAGNFATPSKGAAANVGWWNATKSGEKMDREKIFNPQQR